MAFIAIHAKADITTNDIIDTQPASTTKKGKFTPQQAAILNSFSLTGKTGVLDIGKKCALINDAVSIVGGKVELTFQDGYFLICGRLIECQDGTTYTIDADSVNTGDIIVAEFDKSNQKNDEFTIKIVPKNSSFDNQSSLLEDGIVYQLPMYTITKSSTTISFARHSLFSSYIHTTSNALSSLANMIKDSPGAPLYNYNKGQGTVEDRFTNISSTVTNISNRLDKLGFKSGAITFGGTSYSPNAQTAATATQGLFRQGNYVVGKLILTNNSRTGSPIDISIGTIPENFRPIKNERITVFATMGTNFDPTYGSSSATSVAFMTINANGIVTRISVIADAGIPFAGTYRSWLISFGYEAPPIN